MNSLIQYHRQRAPNDPRTDEQLVLEIGDRFPNALNYDDFRSDYDRLERERRIALAPGLGTELTEGVRRGYHGLLSTVYGGAATAAGAVGADRVRGAFEGFAEGRMERAAEHAPTIRGVEDIQGVGDAARFVAGGVGEVLPSLAETAVAGVGGAVLGTAVAPGPGTAGGFITGIARSQALRSLAKKGVQNATAQQVAREARSVAAQHGAQIAVALNAYALSSGAVYNELVDNQNVDPEQAINVALLGGLVGAVPNTFLPYMVIRRYFGGAPADAANRYVLRVANEMLKTVPIEAFAEGWQEVVQLASQRYADPTMRHAPITQEEINRVINASTLGGIAGAISAPAAAGPRARSPVSPHMDQYTGQLSDEEVNSLTIMAHKDVRGQLTQTDRQWIDNLPENLRNAYVVMRGQIEVDDSGAAISRGERTEEQVTREVGEAIADPEIEQVSADPVAADPAPVAPTTPAPEIEAQTTDSAARQAIEGDERIDAIRRAALFSDESTPPAWVDSIVERARQRALNQDRVLLPLKAESLQQPLPQTEAQQQAESARQPDQPAAPIEPEQQPTPVREEAPAPDAEQQQPTQVDPETETVTPPQPVPYQPSEPAVQFAQMVDVEGGVTRQIGHPVITRLPANPSELGRVATHGARVASDANLSKNRTRRTMALLDNQTGETVLVGVYDNRGVKAVDPDRSDGRGVALERLLARTIKGRDQDQRYTPVEVFRMKAPVDKFSMRMSEQDFNHVRDDVSQRVGETLGQAEVFESTEGTITDGQQDVTTRMDEGYVPSDMNAEFADALIDTMPRERDGTIMTELVVEDIRDVLSEMHSDTSKAAALMFAFRDSMADLKNDADFLAMNTDQQREALFNHVALRVYDNYKAGTLESGIAPPEVAQAGQGQDQASTSDAGPGSERGRFDRRPAPDEAPVRDPVVRATFNRVLNALVSAGANVQLFRTRLTEITNEFWSREGGSFDGAQKLVTLVMDDVVNPTRENMRTLLHEAVHFVFAGESDTMKARIISAMNRVTDADIGLHNSPDPRIADTNPSGLDPTTLAQERLAEKLATQFDQAQTHNIVNSIFRVIKDLYYRVSIAVQHALLGEDHTNPNLMISYMENRLAMLAGRRTNGAITILGGGMKPKEVTAGLITPVTGDGTEPIFLDWASQTIIYPDAVPDSTEAALYNANLDNVLFRKPGRLDEATELGSIGDLENILNDIAANNEVSSILESMFEQFNNAGLNTDNITFEQFHKMIGVRKNPKAINDETIAAVRETNRDIPDHDIMMGDIQNPAARMTAARKALKQINNLKAKMASLNHDAAETIKTGDAKLERNNERLKALRERFQDADAVFAEAMTEVTSKVARLNADVRRGVGSGLAEGILAQQIKIVEGLRNRAIPQNVLDIVNRVADGYSKDRIGFTDMLRAVSRLDIDWRNTSFDSIRNQITEASKGEAALRPIAENTPEGRAGFSIVSALAQSDTEVLSWLALRESNDQSAIASTMNAIKAIMSDADDAADSASEIISRMPRMREAAGRIAASYASAKRNHRQIVREINDAKAFQKTYPPIVRSLYADAAPIENELGAMLTVPEVVDGAVFFLPKNDKVTPDEVVQNRIEIRVRDDSAPPPQQWFQWMDQMQRWLNAHEQTRGVVWNTVAEQLRKMQLSTANQARGVIQRSMVGTVFGSIGNQMADTATRTGRSIRQRVNRYLGLVEEQRLFVAKGHEWLADGSRAKKAMGLADMDTFFRMFYDPAISFFRANDTITDSDALIGMWIRRLESDPQTRQMIQSPGAIQQLQRFYRRTEELNRGKNNARQRMNVSVKDDVLGLFREAIGNPLSTIQRIMAPETELMRDMMNRLGWKTKMPTKQQTAKMFEEGDPALGEVLQQLFTPEVIDQFVVPLVTNERPQFRGAGQANGIMPLASREDIITAWQNSGDNPLDFATNLYEMTVTDRDAVTLNDFVAETLSTFGSFFNMVDSNYLKAENSKKDGMALLQHQIMDDRVTDDLPWQWTRYQRFDQKNNRIMVNQLAMHSAFGRNLDAIMSDFDTAIAELERYASQLDSISDRVSRQNPGLNRRQLRDQIKAEADRIGGKDHFRRIENAKKNLPKARKNKEQFKAWIQTYASGLVEMKAMLEVVSTIAHLAVQGPKTAILNLLSMFDPVTRLGPSRIAFRQVGENWRSMIGETMGSFMGAFGRELEYNSEKVLRRNSMGRLDTDLHVAATDRIRAIMELDVEGNTLQRGVTRGARIVRELLQTAIRSPVQREAEPGRPEFATLKGPHAIFTNFAQWMRAGTIDGVWSTFDDVMSRMVDFVSDPANAHIIRDPNFKISPEMLGFRKQFFGFIDDAKAFNTVREMGYDYGVNMERRALEVARERAAGRDVPLFTNDQYSILANIAQNEITLEANLANVPTELFTNPILRIGTPLLRWSIARMEQVRRSFREPNGDFNWRSGVVGGMKMFAIIAPVGIGWSLLMDQYDERLTGRKSNLRELSRDDLWLASIERMARVGTFGLTGDILNTTVNLADGGDLRGFSIDRRALFMNSILNSLEATTTFFRQGGTASYATVYRPMIQALGGSGYLQIGQIVNTMASPDLPGFRQEARVTARINANNYLRAAGRTLGLDVRTGTGGRTMPTRVRLFVGEMYLAAIGNDPVAFREAHRKAIQAAREAGQEDPEDHVRRSFQFRHPLRTIFRTPPSEPEYRGILTSISPSGQRDVSEAINLINHYSDQIGVRPFEGRAERRQSRPRQASSSPFEQRLNLVGQRSRLFNEAVNIMRN